MPHNFKNMDKVVIPERHRERIRRISIPGRYIGVEGRVVGTPGRYHVCVRFFDEEKTWDTWPETLEYFEEPEEPVFAEYGDDDW